MINFTSFSDFARKSDILEIELAAYFMCELHSHDPNNSCDQERVEIGSEVPVILSYALLGLLPIVNLVFVINFQGLKNTVSQMLAKKGAEANTRDARAEAGEQKAFKHGQ